MKLIDLNCLTITTTIVLSIQHLTHAQSTNSSSQRLNVTALTGFDNASILQCWQLTTPFTIGTDRGIIGSLIFPFTNTANVTYTVIKPRSNGGLHNAPRVQWAAFISGLAHFTLPNTTASPTTEAWIQGGRYGLLFVADTIDVSDYGHNTEYPGDADTVVLQIPAVGGQVPEHSVLYQGPCDWQEFIGS